MSTITTYTRKHFDPVHPDPGLLCVEDFAHALPMICRGNGHVTTFWSVGEHCICCAKEAAARGYSRRLVLACLLHDASECYMSDVPRPLKQEMPRYREIEDHLLSVIYEKYLGSDLTAEEQRMMKQIDNDLLWYDLTNLLEEPQAGDAPKLHITLDYTVRPFAAVEQEYLELFEQYRETGEERIKTKTAGTSCCRSTQWGGMTAGRICTGIRMSRPRTACWSGWQTQG